MSGRLGGAVEKEAKARLEKIVDLALDVLLSQDTDAGWQSSGVLGRALDFGGAAPSGRDVSLSVWRKSLLLGDWSARHREAFRLFERLSEKGQQALMLRRACLNRTRIVVDSSTGERKERRLTAEVIAEELGITPGAFRNRVALAYAHLEKELAGRC